MGAAIWASGAFAVVLMTWARSYPAAASFDPRAFRHRFAGTTRGL